MPTINRSMKLEKIELRFENNTLSITDGEEIDVHNCQLSVCSVDEATKLVYRITRTGEEIKVINLCGKRLSAELCVPGCTQRSIDLKGRAFQLYSANEYACLEDTHFSFDIQSGHLTVTNASGSNIFVIIDFEPDDEFTFLPQDRVIETEGVKSMQISLPTVKSDFESDTEIEWW